MSFYHSVLAAASRPLLARALAAELRTATAAELALMVTQAPLLRRLGADTRARAAAAELARRRGWGVVR